MRSQITPNFSSKLVTPPLVLRSVVHVQLFQARPTVMW